MTTTAQATPWRVLLVGTGPGAAAGIATAMDRDGWHVRRCDGPIPGPAAPCPVDAVVLCLPAAPVGPPSGAPQDPLEIDRGPVESFLLPALRTARAVLPAMVETGRGRMVIALSTDVAAAPDATLVAGCVAGVLGLAKTIAREVAADGVTVNVVMDNGTPAAAEMVAFLASADAGYITGQTLRPGRRH
jgi:NAD(P)-dependent dehydrogenase (short-subunit alcohol dehydrogenase family)